MNYMLSQHLLLFAWVLIHPFFASPSQIRKKQNMFSFTKNPLNTVPRSAVFFYVIWLKLVLISQLCDAS